MTTGISLNRFLDVQFQSWGHRDKKQKSCCAGPVLAISRQPGCDGGLIARTLAEEFGLVVYDSKIVEAIAKDAQVSKQVVATLEDNCRSELDEWLDSITLGPALSSGQYMRCLRKTLFTIATHGNAVILGRGGNFLLPPEKRTLGLYLVAPRAMRVKNIMQEFGLSQEMALKHLARMEREQRMWVKKYGCTDITDATNYHLVINTELVTPEGIVDIVRATIGVKNHDIKTKAVPCNTV